VTVNLSGYVLKANNLSDLTNLATARDNLGLGSLSTPTFAGVNVPGSGTSVANLGATSLTINQQGSGQFTIQPSQGIVFPDASVQTTAFTTAQLTAYLVKASNLSDLTSASSARTNLGLGSLAVVNDAPSDGSQYARKNGAWDVVAAGADFISSVSSPLAVTTGNLTIDLSAYAPLASPAFTGTPTAPTPTFGDNDTSIATTAFVQAGLLGGTAVAKNLEVEVRNQSGSTIPAGSIVYISGATGNKPLITLAQANNDANSAQTIGFVKTSIANNGTGFVIVRGELENIDTSALTEGVQLYLSPTTAGTWTTSKPSAPQHLVYVGIVIRSHPTLGVILVAVQNGYELGEIHDVALSGLANNDLLAYESSTDLWKNKTYSALGLLTSSAAASTYAPIASPTFTGTVTIPAGASISGFAPLASPALTGNVTITSNSTDAALFIQQAGTGNILTLHDQAADTTFVAIDANGKVNTIASEATNGAGFNVPHGTAPTTPVNGDIWTTTSGLFMRQNGTTQQYVDLAGTQTINGSKTFSNASQTLGNSTAAGTINIGSGATISASTKTVNVGTGGVVGSTTLTTIGPVLGASTTSIGGTTAASTLNLATGATLTATTKAVNIGTSGVAGSTTNITIGSTTGTSTTTLQGITNGVTEAVDTNNTELATTAFVVGQAGSATPLVDGTAAVGTSLRYARQDHVHGTDTTRAPLASPTFTGTVTIPAGASISGFAPLASPAFTGTPSLPTGTTAVTQTAGNNTTAVATTAFVTAAVPAFGAQADINEPLSSTKAASIENVRDMLLSQAYQMFYQGLGTNGTSGTSASVNANSGRWKEYVGPNSAVAGHAKGVYDTTSTGIGFAGYQRGANLTSRNWSKKIWMSGRCMIGHFSLSTYNGSANSFARVSLGGYTAIGAGDMNSIIRGIGWRLQGGGSSALELQVCNGTTVTNVTSSFTPVLKECFDWEIYSDGAGNVTLFVNDSQVATTTAGPTGTQSSGLYMEGIDATASSTAAFILNNLGTKIYYGI
jgi:hypothetical protein